MKVKNAITVKENLFKSIVFGKADKMELPLGVKAKRGDIFYIQFFDEQVNVTQRYYLRVKKVSHREVKWYRRIGKTIVHL